MNSEEKELLLEARYKNAELALKTLEKHQESLLEHRPEEFINRNYHLTANMHGMNYWDEVKFCIKRSLQIIGAKILPDAIYNKIFPRREFENF